MIKNIFSLIITATFLTLALFLNSCNDLPTEIGTVMIPDTLQLYSINSKEAAIITHSENYAIRPESYLAGQVFVGNFEETTSIGFLRFGNVPDTLDNITENDIISATLTMQPANYAYGNFTNGNQNFKVYDMVKAIYKETNYLAIQDSGGINSYIGTEAGHFTGTIMLKDSADPVKIDISKQVMAEWFAFAASGDTSNFSHSFGLVPQAGSNVITKFQSAMLNLPEPTQLQIIYRNNGNIDTLNLKSLINTYFANAPLTIDQGLIMQGGIGYASELHFDFSQIPAFSSIHKAQLELTLDTDRSHFSSLGVDSIISVYYPLRHIGVGGDSLVSYQGKLESNGKYVFPSVSSAVENIISNDKGSKHITGDGKGFITIYPNLHGHRLNNMFSFLDKYVFYGPDATDVANRPVLKIIYSTRPDIKPE